MRMRTGLAISILAAICFTALGQQTSPRPVTAPPQSGGVRIPPPSTVPLPPPPTKADLYDAVAQQLNVESCLLAVINADDWLGAKLKDAGVSDLSRVPGSFPLPYDTLVGWHGQKRFKLLVIDTTLPTKADKTVKELGDRLEKVEAGLKEIDGHADDLVTALADIASRLEKIEKSLAAPVAPPAVSGGPAIPAPTADPAKKPFFPEIK